MQVLSFREMSSNWGGATSNLQGGAIYARADGGTVTLTISNTEFKSNTADSVSEILSIC